MVAVGDSLYVLGGFDDEAEERFSTLMSVEKFGVMSGNWEDCGYLTFPMRSASASVVRDTIYLFGGIEGDGTKSSAVQCFDTRDRSCTHLTDLPLISGMSSIVVCNMTTYLVFPNGQVLKMDGSGEIENVGTISGFERCGFGIVQHEGNIIIIGGIDSTEIYDEFMIFDPSSGDTTTTEHQLLSPLFGFGCAKATISRTVFR